MEAFLNLIQRITQYGTQTVADPNKRKALKKSLTDLYALYVNLEPTFDERLYEEIERLDYGLVYAHVKVNFPEFHDYQHLEQFLNPDQQPKILLGDAIDDLSDLIIDLSEVVWRLENTSLDDALWYFNTLMHMHSEAHLLNLLVYLKALESDKN
ncbi:MULTISPECIES: DUF5063 domain-containing protein [unclassified Leeuwenhoekiella]|uniref:DUF5063 domain-containing protein n=1 Tax=unclassified Leeuwenhoekiella TaxID=2615029 RepID=UPI000C40067D|nr:MULTISPECIES: DUF5063 domain-containing protein [unclassified Leeuwenhoekiella]MBA80456.1 DUF5063 domain-containing protein [Leeuwenhoekiella sp.]